MAWSNMDAGYICIAIQDGAVAYADRLVLVLIFCVLNRCQDTGEKISET